MQVRKHGVWVPGVQTPIVSKSLLLAGPILGSQIPQNLGKNPFLPSFPFTPEPVPRLPSKLRAPQQAVYKAFFPYLPVAHDQVLSLLLDSVSHCDPFSGSC